MLFIMLLRLFYAYDGPFFRKVISLLCQIPFTFSLNTHLILLDVGTRRSKKGDALPLIIASEVVKFIGKKMFVKKKLMDDENKKGATQEYPFFPFRL